MKNILLLGCGRSSSWLVKYIFENILPFNHKVTISDFNENFPFAHLFSHPNAIYISANLSDTDTLLPLIQNADVVISLLPPAMHLTIAQQCLAYKKHFLCASYLSVEIQMLHEDAISKDVIMMMEAGLDPGLDHLSAMKEIDAIHEQGGVIDSFKSFTGGLVAPESDTNPWHYKISWNPRNVVLAGQGNMSRYLHNGIIKCIPYHRLFTTITPISIFEKDDFEGYVNRDSLKYQLVYGLQSATTLIRGTIRQKDFCEGWQQLVYMGMTDDSTIIENSEGMTMKDFTKLFMDHDSENENIEQDICQMLKITKESTVFKQLAYLGLFSEEQISIAKATPAQIIQEQLIKKIPLLPHDSDMIVMQHHIEYRMQDERRKREISLIVKGDDSIFTAMAKTVGLPLGIICNMILENKIPQRGVMLPLEKNIYTHVLSEIEAYNLTFHNTDQQIFQ